jgi:hypothetical protein
MKTLMYSLKTRSNIAALCLASSVLVQAVSAQQPAEQTPQIQELLDNLALKAQVTVAEVYDNENLAGNEETSIYSIHIPSMNKVELGMELDVSDPSNGFRVLTVDENNLADQLGIETGDLVVTVNHFEVNVTNTEVILSELQSLQAGDSLALMINRENRLKQFTMTIEGNPLPPTTIYVGKDEFENTAISVVPEPFQRFDDTSTNTINYDVLSQWLDYLVVDVGRSDRRSAHSGRNQITARTGTRIGPKVKKETLFEGNRFFFEGFENNEEARRVLKDVRDSLELIPTSVPLEFYSRDEQLSYWLNLYNITILNEIVAVYPTRDLEEFLVGEKSVLSKKLLTVAGIHLSLNDIQFTILKENYDNNPLIMYGLYQGIIGGPNIRKEAYTGATVYRALEFNAIEFINSNRGTNRSSDKYKVRSVSSLYARNSVYFPDFNTDLSAHLLKYIEGDGRGMAKSKATLKPVINDWTITDFWGTFPEDRFSGVGSPAGLMGALTGDFVGPGTRMMLAKAVGGLTNYSPEVFQYLLVLNMKRVRTNEKNSTVTMEELGEFPVVPEADQKNED